MHSTCSTFMHISSLRVLSICAWHLYHRPPCHSLAPRNSYSQGPQPLPQRPRPSAKACPLTNVTRRQRHAAPRKARLYVCRLYSKSVVSRLSSSRPLQLHFYFFYIIRPVKCYITHDFWRTICRTAAPGLPGMPRHYARFGMCVLRMQHFAVCVWWLSCPAHIAISRDVPRTHHTSIARHTALPVHTHIAATTVPSGPAITCGELEADAK